MLTRLGNYGIRLSVLLVLACFNMASIAQDGQLLQGGQVAAPNDRLHSQTERDVRITAAVPSALETREIFKSDLYRQNIQPVWVQVENLGDEQLFLTPMGLDSGYYTAREVASRSRGSITTQPRNRDFEQMGVGRLELPPHSIQSGYIFSRVDEGTKPFNVDVIGGVTPYMMTFFVPVPGLKLDHHEIDIANLYPEDELRHVNLQQLAKELEAMPCCVRNKKGDNTGGPLNLVFVGEIQHMYYAFMRAGWDETETIHGASLWKTAASAVTGGKYRPSKYKVPVSTAKNC